MSSSLADYFAQHRPRPRWQGGERVQGLYQGMPFIGTVGYENMRNEDEGLMALIHLDLPVKVGDTWTTVIRVKPRTLQLRDTGPFVGLARLASSSGKPSAKRKS